MRYTLFLLGLLFFFESCRNCDCGTISFPDISKPPRRSVQEKGPQLSVSITAESRVIADSTEIPYSFLDSLLGIKINKIKKYDQDTVTMVVTADSAAAYGVLFGVLRAGKKHTARVVANMKQ